MSARPAGSWAFPATAFIGFKDLYENGGEAALIQAMQQKLRRAGRRSRYRLRKHVEPVFGQIKQARGFRQFLLRGIEKVGAEWATICTAAHNLRKLAGKAA